MAIGWDDLGDLSQFGSVEDVVTALEETYNPQTRPTNDARTCYDFVRTIKPGDLIFAKRGKQRIVGYGVVTGGYEYRPERTVYPSIRTVRWEGRGDWKSPSSLAIKTLTDLTGAPDFVQALKKFVTVLPDEPPLPVPPTVRESFSLDQALDGLFMPRPEFERALGIWRAKKNLILQGAPGVGKSFVAKRLAYALMGYRDPSRVRAVQFHQSYSYEDFVQGYRPDGNGSFVLKAGLFLEFCERALSDPNEKYVFIIDEINRGNLSKILGELMLLIEPDKRSSDWATKLAYAQSAEERFYVPPNIYLLGMMNTADRSLSMVDYALRRRFAFVTLRPEYTSGEFRNELAAGGALSELIDRIINRMGALNAEIADDKTNLGPGFCVGHSFFASIADGVTPDNAWYRQIIETEIGPLLGEYWFDNPERALQWQESLLA
jgi:5-methylcytosine-specific restriction protein B